MICKLTNKSVVAIFPKEKPFEIWDVEIKGFVLRVQPTGKKIYYFSYRNAEGKRHRYRIGTHGTVSPAQAREVAIRLSGKVALGVDVHIERKTEKVAARATEARTLRKFLDEHYRPWAEVHLKSGSETVKRINTQFACFIDRQMEEITIWEMEKWRHGKLKKGIKPATTNRNSVVLKSLLSKAVDWGVIDQNPLAKFKPLKMDDNRTVRYLSETEEMCLRKALSDRETRIRNARSSGNKRRLAFGKPVLPEYDKTGFVDHLQPMVLLSINTGLRRGEIFRLTWGNISLSKNVLTVAGTTSKNGKTRHVPLNKEAVSVLKKWGKPVNLNDVVFPSKSAKYLCDVKKSWKKLLKDACISEFRWHDMRHHFASMLVMAGVDLNTVRELLGHQTIQMTLRYAHLAPQYKADAVAKLGRNC